MQLSVKDRLKALNLQEVGRAPSNPSKQTTPNAASMKARPPPPPRPNVPPRSQSTSLPPANGCAPATSRGIGNEPEADKPSAAAHGMDGISRPALPPRTSAPSSSGPALPSRRPAEQSPALPPRRPSETPSQSEYALTRRPSNESISSIATARSARSSVSGISTGTSQSDRYSIRAPAYDASALPPLPPKRTEEQKQAYYDSAKPGRRPLKSTFSSPNVSQAKQDGTTPPPAKPPALSQRTILPPPEPQKPRRSALEMGLSQVPKQSARSQPELNGAPPPVQPPRPGAQANGAPPPVPRDSRPDLASLLASKPTLNGTTNAPVASAMGCLHCRDFSRSDAHAARFPRHSVPNGDINWLAHQLTAPFDNKTDKARAIFTWHHHNIRYDTVSFFSGNLKPSTPQSTLTSGLAVCEGYAGLFAALALKAGLEAVVISGHGKGFGYSQLAPGQPVPAYNAGHAWNAVKLDDGRWKLLDACWGSGHLHNNEYKAEFAPDRFTQSNDEFGLDHFPGDASKQYRSDGRTLSWTEYITGNKRGCGAQFFSGCTSAEGISEPSFRPLASPIVLAQQPGPTVRFSFQKVCPHWTPERNGKGPRYLYTLAIDAQEGNREKNHVPFETNGDVWWVDIPVGDLGRPGQGIKVLCVTSWDGKDARGLSIQDYRSRMGRVGMAWAFVAEWKVG